MLIWEGQRPGHVSLDDLDRIPFSGGDLPFAFQLAVGVVEDRDVCPQRGEHGHLLTAAAGQA